MRKGIVDGLVMRTMDGILAFPEILFAILLVAAFGASIFTIILVMSIVYIPNIYLTSMHLKHCTVSIDCRSGTSRRIVAYILLLYIHSSAGLGIAVCVV